MNNVLTPTDIVQRLCQAGFDTFLVGGCVRDIFLGKEPSDFDIATQAAPEQVEALFSDRSVKSVGKSFGVILVDGHEVATFRHDRHAGIGDKNCTVYFAESVHEDLERRDFTVNAMAMCALTGNIVDDHNGTQDVNKKLIRFVGDPVARIFEDPNRILRACRFLAYIDGEFDKTTFETLRNHSHLVGTHIAPERIRLEVLKAMKIRHASMFFEALHNIGALFYIFSAMSLACGHQHGIHHLETVFDHLMLVGDAVSPKFPLVKLAGYLHDCGKPIAFSEGKFIGHEESGAVVVESDLRRLKFSNEEVETVVGLVRNHMAQFEASKPKSVRKFLRKLAENSINLNDWIRLRLADRRGNLKKEPRTITEIKQKYLIPVKTVYLPDTTFKTTSLALSGGELMRRFNLTPGPVVGQLQRHLLDRVVEEGFEFNTEDFLVNEAEKFLEEVRVG